MERTDQPTPQHSPTRSSQANTWLSTDLYAELARIRANAAARCTRPNCGCPAVNA